MAALLYVTLGVLGIICYFINNKTMAISIAFLLIMKATPLRIYFPYLEKQGLSVGILILTIAVLSPLVSGSFPLNSLLKSLTDWRIVVAILVGIVVSWLGGRGVTMMTTQPGITGGLIVGTVIGVALFRGVPVGPLIAAGIVSLFIFSR